MSRHLVEFERFVEAYVGPRLAGLFVAWCEDGEGDPDKAAAALESVVLTAPFGEQSIAAVAFVKAVDDALWERLHREEQEGLDAP